jgi:electron transfer flavoprotein beta subunit
MNIIACVKWVPETSEADLAVDKGGTDIKKEDLDHDINDWDRFAVEEAIRIKEKVGGKVTVVSVASDDAEEMLRESLARGADEAFALWDDSFAGSDGYAVSSILASFIKSRPYDLVITGTLADDDCAGQVGGMLSAMLGIPCATLVNNVEAQEGKVVVRRELEGGLSEEFDIDLPAVVAVATGINEPRFVSIRAVRKVAGAEIPTLERADIGIDEALVGDAGSKIKIEKVFMPPEGEGAEMITGGAETVAARLAEILKEKGGLG